MAQEFRSVSKLSFVLAIFLSFFVNLDSAITIPIIANYARELGASIAFAGIIVGAYSAAHIPSNVFLGRIADKLGRKKSIFLGFAFDGVAVFIYYMSNNPVHLLIGRIIHGVGGGFGGPASMSYIGDTAPRERSGRVMALYGISVATSYLLGMVIGGVLSSYIGYKPLFYYLSITLFGVALLSLLLQESYSGVPSRLSFKEELSIFSRVFFNRALSVSYLSIISISVASGVLASAYAIYLKSIGYEDMHVGMFFGLATLVSLLIHYPSGMLGDKVGKKKVIMVGLLVQALGFIILALMGKAGIIIGMILWGFAHGLVYPNSSGIIREHTEMEYRGVASGVFYALLVAGVAIGAPIAGMIAETSFSLAIMLGAWVPLLIVIFIFFL